MRNLIRNAVVIAGLMLSPACFAQETYSNPTLGFTIRKREDVSALRLAFLTLILAGIIGLKILEA